MLCHLRENDLILVYIRLTFDLDPRLKIVAPNESPYKASYMFIIQMKSLSLRIFAKISFVTFGLDARSKFMTPYESPFMISYIIKNKSLTFIVCEIFVEKAFLTF